MNRSAIVISNTTWVEFRFWIYLLCNYIYTHRGKPTDLDDSRIRVSICIEVSYWFQMHEDRASVFQFRFFNYQDNYKYTLFNIDLKNYWTPSSEGFVTYTTIFSTEQTLSLKDFQIFFFDSHLKTYTFKLVSCRLSFQPYNVLHEFSSCINFRSLVCSGFPLR